MVNLGSAYGEVIIGTQGSEKQLQSLAATLRGVGTTMSLAISTPLIGVATAGLKAAMGFEQSMNMLQVATDATEQAMTGLQQKALQLGAETSFSAGEAADAMLELAKAGMSADETMAAIGGVLDLAAAGGVGLAQAATITAAALNAFHLPAQEAANVANLLAAAANASAADVTDLAQGLQQGGFAFGAAGQHVDDLVASLAILTNVGLTGSDAGTALKNAMVRLMNPTKTAAGLMKKLGIDVYDAQGNMKPFADVIDAVNQGTKGMTQEERNAALSTIFLSDGMKAFIPLLDVGKDGFLAMKEEVNKEGAASEMAAARMKGLAGAIEYIKGSIESVLIEVALPFLDFLSNTIRRVADTITQFTKLPTPIRNAVLAFLAVLAAIGPVVLALGTMGSVLAALLSPIGLIGIAIGAMAAAWVANVGGIQEKTAAMWAVVQPVFEEMGRVIGRVVNVARAIWMVPKVIGVLAEYFETMGFNLFEAMAVLQEFGTALGLSEESAAQFSIEMLGLTGGLSAVQRPLSDVVQRLMNVLQVMRMVPRVIGVLVESVTSFGFNLFETMAVLNEFWAALGLSDEQASRMNKGVLAVIGTISRLGQRVAGVVRAIGMVPRVIGVLIENFRTMGFNLFEAMGVLQEFGAALGLSEERIGQLSSVLLGLTGGLNVLRQYFMAVVEDGDYLNDWLGHLPEMIRPVVGWMGRLTATLIGLAKGNDLATLRTNLLSAFADIGGAVRDFFSGDISLGGLAGAVQQGFIDIRNSLADFFGGKDFQSVASTIAVAWNGLVDAVVNAWNAIDWSGIGANLKGLVSSIGNYLAGIEWSAIGEWLGSFVTSIGNYLAGIDWSVMTVPLNRLVTAVGSFLSGIDWRGGLESVRNGANRLRDGVLAALANGINGVDWSGMSLSFAGMVDWLAKKIDEIDWSQLNLANIGKALMAVIAPAITASIAAVNWVMSSKNWAGLVAAVKNAFLSIEWGEMGASFQRLGFAIGNAIAELDWSSVTVPLNRLVTAVGSFLSGIDWRGGLESVRNGANRLRDGVLAALTSGINSIDWSGMSLSFAGVVDWLAKKIDEIDWSQLSVADIGQAIMTVLSPGIMTSIAEIRWVMSSENWAGLVEAVKNAFLSIEWGEIGASLLGLVAAIGNAIAELDWSPVTTAFDTLKTMIVDALPTVDEVTTALNGLRDRIVQGLADLFAGLDLTATLTGLLDALSAAITNTDWAAVGSALGSAVSFVLSEEGLKAIFKAAVAGIAPALTAAVAGIVWVFSSENWSNLMNAIVDSITNIDWSAVGDAFGRLKDAIVEALGELVSGFGDAFQAPEWINSLLAWKFPEPKELISWVWPPYIKWTWPIYSPFLWPAYAVWLWPTYVKWIWPEYLTWTWPPYLTWTWPDIPTPGWLDRLLNWSPSWPSWLGGGGGGDASQSSVAPSGISNGVSLGAFNITIHVASANGEMDWNRAAKRVAREVALAMR